MGRAVRRVSLKISFRFLVRTDLSFELSQAGNFRMRAAKAHIKRVTGWIIGWWWVNARRRRRRTPDLGILTALQEREPERSGREA
jgi:hypothetical protein